MKKFPKTTMEQRKKVIKAIKSGNYDKGLLVDCIRDVQPGLVDEYIQNLVNKRSYDMMYIPIDRKWFYECRKRIVSLYIERM